MLVRLPGQTVALPPQTCQAYSRVVQLGSKGSQML